jgi:uncharacterized repeat protein (TIGR01451 family)
MSVSHTSVHDPSSRSPTFGAAFCSLLATALLFLLLPAGASAQDATTCDYADPGSGPMAENICWIDFSDYVEATSRSAAGQDLIVSLPGGYTASVNVHTTGTGSAPGISPNGVPYSGAPNGSAINNPTRPGSYTGISGQPALISWMSNGQSVNITLRNIVVRDAAGNQVTGYSLLAADPEVTEVYERITWTADQPWDLVARLHPPASPLPPNGCQNTAFGFGTNTVVCQGAVDGTTPNAGYGSVLIKADGATTVTANLAEIAPFPRFGGESTAFAFVTSKVKVTKNVEGRVRASDSFDVSATSPEGTTVGSARTGGANSAATEELTVLPRVGGQSYTLGEAVTPGSGTRLEDYSQSWSCTRNGVVDAALSTSGGTSRAVAPEPGELIACTVTNTQLPADVTIEKSTSEPVVPGAEATFTLRMTNNGPSRATNETASDPLPAGLSFVSASAGCSEAGGMVTCTATSLDPGAFQEFTVTARADASADCDDLANTVTVTGATPDPDMSNNSSTVRNCERRSDLRMTKDPSSAQVTTGGQVMYTLVVENLGPSDDSNVTATDPMAAGLSLVSADPSQGTCSTAGGRVSCDLGDLKAGGSAQILVTATMTAPGAVGAGASCNPTNTITNTATVGGDAFDPNPDNNRDDAQVCPTPDPTPRFDLVTTKSANDRSLVIGQPVRYRIVVRNNGPDAAPNVIKTDTLNAPVKVVSVKSTQGSCRKRIPMRCELGTIQAGARVTITIRAKHRESGCRQRNAASATGAGIDANPANNMDTVDVCVRPVKLKLTKVASRRVVQGGQTFSYRIRLRNPTKGEARKVKVCDRLPFGLRYVSSKPKAKTSGRQRCWTVKVLKAGKSRTFRVTVRAANGASGRKTNTATATSPDVRRPTRARDRVQVRGIATPVTG